MISNSWTESSRLEFNYLLTTKSWICLKLCSAVLKTVPSSLWLSLKLPSAVLKTVLSCILHSTPRDALRMVYSTFKGCHSQAMRIFCRARRHSPRRQSRRLRCDISEYSQSVVVALGREAQHLHTIGTNKGRGRECMR